MGPDVVQGWLLNPLLWVSLAVVVLMLELMVVSGAGLALGVAGVLVGLLMWLLPVSEESSVVEAGRLVLTVAAVWSLFSLVVVVALRFWFVKRGAAADPNEVGRGVGVETGDTKTAEIEPPAYKDVLEGYRSRLE